MNDREKLAMLLGVEEKEVDAVFKKGELTTLKEFKKGEVDRLAEIAKVFIEQVGNIEGLRKPTVELMGGFIKQELER